jgi:L,D-transpeptidase ErfK/SrfK
MKWFAPYLISVACGIQQQPEEQVANRVVNKLVDSPYTACPEKKTTKHLFATIKANVKMKDYFSFMDSLAKAVDTTTLLNEYILVHANPWILDTLQSLDYYQQKAKSVFIYDQSQQIVLHAGDSILLPDSTTVASISGKLRRNRIVVNLPEFTLRIIQDKDTLFTCPVRIGKNTTAYLEYYQRMVDLRTPIGEGEIIMVRRNPKYVNLQTGEEYVETKRDDGRRTKMPMIPSLEPSINGKQLGTLIHATTNRSSLGKIYSHGCVGTSEADMWTIYYNAPIGTRVNFCYNLEINGSGGTSIQLNDVYQLNKK